MKVKIEGIFNLIGRGWILYIRDSRLSNREIHCGTTVTADGKVFTINATERNYYGNGLFEPSAGIRLRPNDQVEECFHVGQDIEIETTESKRED